MDDLGNAWVAYVQYDTGSTIGGKLLVAELPEKGTKLTNKIQLKSPYTVTGRSVSVALDSGGAPYVAWIDRTSTGTHSVRWSRKPSGSKWTGPHHVASNKSFGTRTHLAVAPTSGNAHISFPLTSGKLYHAMCKP